MDKELMHYGTLGMKWGVRRANRKANRKETRKIKAHDMVRSAVRIKENRKQVRKDKGFIVGLKQGWADDKNTRKVSAAVRKGKVRLSDLSSHELNLYKNSIYKKKYKHKGYLGIMEAAKYGKEKKPKVSHSDWTGEELMHYGTLGMKWGVRRALGKGGLIVKSGKAIVDRTKMAGNRLKAGVETKRKLKEAKRIEKATKADQRLQAAKERALASRTAPGQKAQQQATNQSYHQDHIRLEKLKRTNIKDMSNDDISFLTKRVALEKQYNQIQSEAYAKAHPYKTAAKKIVKDLQKEAGKAAGNAAKNYVLGKVNDLAKELGLPDMGLGKGGGNKSNNQQQSQKQQSQQSQNGSKKQKTQQKQSTNKGQNKNSNPNVKDIFKDYDFVQKKWNTRPPRIK